MSTVLFLHGLEGNPRARKAVWLRERYGAHTPELDTTDLQNALRDARAALAREQPSVVVASSFGGAVLLELVHEGTWKGPCVFLAQAGCKLTEHRTLPQGIRAILIHGRADEIIPIEDSRLLAATGGPGVELIEVEDEHRLRSVLEDGTLERALRSLGFEPLKA